MHSPLLAIDTQSPSVLATRNIICSRKRLVVRTKSCSITRQNLSWHVYPHVQLLPLTAYKIPIIIIIIIIIIITVSSGVSPDSIDPWSRYQLGPMTTPLPGCCIRLWPLRRPDTMSWRGHCFFRIDTRTYAQYICLPSTCRRLCSLLFLPHS